MELVKEILTFLETNGVGDQGVDLFRGFLPDDPDNATMVIATGGLKPSQDLPIRDRSVQITVRDVDYEQAEAKITQIYQSLHGMNDSDEFTIGGLDVMSSYALQEPTNIGKDESGRTIFTCNFIIKTRQ